MTSNSIPSSLPLLAWVDNELSYWRGGIDKPFFKHCSLPTGAPRDTVVTASTHMTFDVYVDVIATVWSAVSFDGVSGESLPIPVLSILGFFLFPWDLDFDLS